MENHVNMNRACQNGWTLPFIPVLLIIVGILIYYFGWSVIFWVIGAILIITLCVYIHDLIKGNKLPDLNEEVQPDAPQMNGFSNIESAIQAINEFEGEASDFGLYMPDELQDPAGFNMAIITDTVLKKGWEPNGFEQFNGYRIYYYKDME